MMASRLKRKRKQTNAQVNTNCKYLITGKRNMHTEYMNKIYMPYNHITALARDWYQLCISFNRFGVCILLFLFDRCNWDYVCFAHNLLLLFATLLVSVCVCVCACARAFWSAAMMHNTTFIWHSILIHWFFFPSFTRFATVIYLLFYFLSSMYNWNYQYDRKTIPHCAHNPFLVL